MSGPKRILVTGSRQWTQSDDAALMARRRQRVRDALEAAFMLLCPSPESFVLVHGAARGLDQLAAEVAQQDFSLPLEAHPAQWRTPTGGTDKTAGFTRNQQMVDLGAALCLGFPLHPQQATGKDTSRGTWDCLRRAQEAGLPTAVVWKDRIFSCNEPVEQMLTTRMSEIGEQPLRSPDGSVSAPVSRMVIPF